MRWTGPADGQKPDRSAFIKEVGGGGSERRPPRVTLGAIDGTFGVIGGDITPRRKRLGVTKS